MAMELEKDVNFLFELGTLRYIPRTWRQFLGADFANVAEHTFRVTWIAMLLAKAEGADLDKVIKMTLFHDISESRTGDVHYITRLYTERNEEKAIDDMVTGTSLEQEIRDIVHEYEARETLEAKIAKDADTLDVDMELMEEKGRGGTLQEVFKEQRKRVSELLFTGSAKALWKQIYQTDPHGWHLAAPNRLTHGDWKPQN